MKDSDNQTQPSAGNAETGVVKYDGPKSTPGPWSFDTIAMETGDYGISQRDLRISICHVHNAASFGDFIAGAMKRGGGKFEQSDAHTQMANALLIAAAPDMLAACKAAIAYDAAIQAYGNDPQKMDTYCTGKGEYLDDLYFDWIEKSRAALSKAEPTT